MWNTANRQTTHKASGHGWKRSLNKLWWVKKPCEQVTSACWTLVFSLCHEFMQRAVRRRSCTHRTGLALLCQHVDFCQLLQDQAAVAHLPRGQTWISSSDRFIQAAGRRLSPARRSWSSSAPTSGSWCRRCRPWLQGSCCCCCTFLRWVVWSIVAGNDGGTYWKEAEWVGQRTCKRQKKTTKKHSFTGVVLLLLQSDSYEKPAVC